MKKYDHARIEPKWQKEWEFKKLWAAPKLAKKNKFYGLIEFPYPSGAGLHVGHVRSNTAMDIIAHKRRAEGYDVLYPIGWDAFGLPTENYAIKTGIPPAKVTKQNTDTFRKQLKRLGFSFDWSREVNTSDPAYFKWTQWIFLQMYKKGLAYKSKMPINWCPSCKIGLANEEVIDGACERCGTPVEKREKEQWMLAITKYAERLYDDLDSVDYLDKIKAQQRNWIGKSEGAEIDFAVVKDAATRDVRSSAAREDGIEQRESVASHTIRVFTTRPDTLFGATFMVVAPEHPIVETLLTHISNAKEVRAYIKQASKKTEIERTNDTKEKTGVRLEGVSAVNPANKHEIPIFIADYVLTHYGTGAIMAVPAHDERDWAFAKKFDIPITQAIVPCADDPRNPPRAGFKEVKRDTIIVHLRDKSTGKFAILRWHETLEGTVTAIMGGIENGQTPEQAALMEIREEAGLKNVRIVKVSPWITAARYCASHKNENRLAHSWVALAEVDSLAGQTVVAAEESKKHTLEWIDESKVFETLTPVQQKQMWRVLQNEEPLIGAGYLVNSDSFSNMDSEEAKKAITEYVGGKLVTTFKLRDWVFSRQRYWGEPIPMIYCEHCGWQPVPEKDLPVTLPKVKKYEPTDDGESPLSVMDKWIKVRCPKCNAWARRETDTMPNWAGSSWYFLRYVDPQNKKTFADKAKLKTWTPVDWYNGGMEHTTLHLLYSRFWHKFLYDLKLVPSKEPYKKRTSHGLILAEGGVKMSKSKGNTISPDDVVKVVGADTLRVYEMFMGPFSEAIAWNTNNMIGVRRFLDRIWRAQELVQKKDVPALNHALHSTIKKVSEDIEEMKFNTAVSAMMMFLNEVEKQKTIGEKQFMLFLRILAPFAPHITEELWHELGNKKSIHIEKWPKVNPKYLAVSEVTIAVSINGKVRGEFRTAANTDQMALEGFARSEVSERLVGKQVVRTVIVPNKLVNFVVKE